EELVLLTAVHYADQSPQLVVVRNRISGAGRTLGHHHVQDGEVIRAVQHVDAGLERKLLDQASVENGTLDDLFDGARPAIFLDCGGALRDELLGDAQSDPFPAPRAATLPGDGTDNARSRVILRAVTESQQALGSIFARGVNWRG